MATDEQLIEQIKQGKSEVFEQLFRKYQKQVYSICLSIVKKHHDAEEVTQDTFVHAYLKIEQLKKPERFSAWLKRIAQNLSKNYLNSKQERTVPLVAATEDISTQTTPERLLLKRELIDAIIEAIESLPQEDKEMIQARINGLSHSEISKQFGISISTSTTRLYRIRKKIKAHVKDLLNAIIGLPKLLSLEKIISGGIVAMKIGTSTKVTIGVIGAIVAGFIGFQTVTHKEPQQVKVKPTEKATQQKTVRPTSQPKSVRKRSDDSEKIQDEQYSDEDIEEALAWLESLEKEEEDSTEFKPSKEENLTDEEMAKEAKRQRIAQLTQQMEILWAQVKALNAETKQMDKEVEELRRQLRPAFPNSDAYVGGARNPEYQRALRRYYELRDRYEYFCKEVANPADRRNKEKKRQIAKEYVRLKRERNALQKSLEN